MGGSGEAAGELFGSGVVGGPELGGDVGEAVE